MPRVDRTHHPSQQRRPGAGLRLIRQQFSSGFLRRRTQHRGTTKPMSPCAPRGDRGPAVSREGLWSDVTSGSEIIRRGVTPFYPTAAPAATPSQPARRFPCSPQRHVARRWDRRHFTFVRARCHSRIIRWSLNMIRGSLPLPSACGEGRVFQPLRRRSGGRAVHGEVSMEYVVLWHGGTASITASHAGNRRIPASLRTPPRG